jgi:hypothetical protein
MRSNAKSKNPSFLTFRTADLRSRCVLGVMKVLPPVASRIQPITLSLGSGRPQDARYPLATRLGAPLAFLLLFLYAALVQPCAATPFQWDFTGSLNNARYFDTATLFPDGRVLAAGGAGIRPGTFPYQGLTSAELYDPVAGTWTLTGSMNVARLVHTATLLPDGTVLVAGGWPNPQTHSGLLQSAELYDPATGIWTRINNMNVARGAHTATLLLNGKVLVVGSHGTNASTSELYDPATGIWSFTGNTTTPHYGYHTADLLPNGKVLVAGGFDSLSHVSASAELYDPATGTWTATGSLNNARHDHRSTLLTNGTVLVEGGAPATGILASAEIYDPATGNWTLTGSLNSARWRHTANLLPNGKVLVAGGINGGGPTASAEIYDPATGTWTITGSLNNARFLDTATLLSNGLVLAAGGNTGYNNGDIIATAELYDPGIGVINLLSAASRLTHGTAGTFDVNMPLTGTSGVEDRSATTYNAVFNFDQPVTSGEVTVLSGTATVGTLSFSGNSITAPLTGVTASEVVTLHVQNVNGDGLPHGDIPFGFLVGDADASRSVAPADKGLVENQLHQPVTSANFREDLDLDGQITDSDTHIVRINQGNSIP